MDSGNYLPSGHQLHTKHRKYKSPAKLLAQNGVYLSTFYLQKGRMYCVICQITKVLSGLKWENIHTINTAKYMTWQSQKGGKTLVNNASEFVITTYVCTYNILFSISWQHKRTILRPTSDNSYPGDILEISFTIKNISKRCTQIYCGMLPVKLI